MKRIVLKAGLFVPLREALHAKGALFEDGRRGAPSFLVGDVRFVLENIKRCPAKMEDQMGGRHCKLIAGHVGSHLEQGVEFWGGRGVHTHDGKSLRPYPDELMKRARMRLP